MKTRLLELARRYLVAGSWLYLTLLFGWLFLYLVFGDRFGYLGLVNSLAVYLFFPLPLMLLIAALFRRREVGVLSALGVVVFTLFWGPFFVPRFLSPVAGNPHSPLRVMTYNVLGGHLFTEPVIDVIQAEAPDVVFLQEVNPTLGEALGAELIEFYPYQVLDPIEGVQGMGVLSRHPMHLTGERLPLSWVGVPQILELDYVGTKVTLVNFHMFALGFRPPNAVDENFRYRESQAAALADFVRTTPGLLVIGGDANATDRNDAYRILARSGLKDAWREAGFGLGHTFPGSDIQGSSRFHIAGYPVPQWMARIDYLFHSPDFQTQSAHLARFDGVSDHRGVVASLVYHPGE
jgi:endonuclease/exonuclease/phosphatase (EEP) superfamily protein YafD